VTTQKKLLIGSTKKATGSSSAWSARELQHDRKLFSDHLLSILHGVLVGAGSPWPAFWGNLATKFETLEELTKWLVKARPGATIFMGLER
jgi:hypothetical protein